MIPRRYDVNHMDLAKLLVNHKSFLVTDIEMAITQVQNGDESKIQKVLEALDELETAHAERMGAFRGFVFKLLYARHNDNDIRSGVLMKDDDGIFYAEIDGVNYSIDQKLPLFGGEVSHLPPGEIDFQIINTEKKTAQIVGAEYKG